MHPILVRFRRLVPFLTPFLRHLVFVFFLSLVGTVLGLLWPLFTKILIDDVLLAKNLQLLFGLSGIMVAATVTGYAVGALNRYLYTQVTARVLFALRQHLFAHLQALSLRFHTRAKVGDLLSRLNTDIAEVQTVLTDTAFTVVTNLLVLVATIGFLLWLHWQLLLVSLLVMPLQLYAMAKIRPQIVQETQRVRELNADIGAFLVESLSAIKFIKQFAVEQLQLEKLGRLGERFVRAVTRYEMLGYVGSTASTATAFLGGILTTLYGGYLVIHGHMTVGSLIAFTAYQVRVFSPLQVLMDLYLRVARAGVSLARIFEFLDLDTDREPRAGCGVRLPQVRGAVEFRQVSFAYDGGEPILCDLSFSIPAGGRCTILGPSGVGKTTVIDLLVRLYDPTAGIILFDGYDVRHLDVAWLRSQIAVVAHEPVLFHASVLENLRYAKPEASLAEVTAAAQVVGLHDFLCSLPDGYDTVVGERGMRLSAGQKQRVALARAVLRQPAVLVLDEALSGLDVLSEERIRAKIDTLMANRTVITVTHRLSSVRPDDTVLVLDQGRARWTGRFGDLAAAPGDLRDAVHEWESQAVQEPRATDP